MVRTAEHSFIIEPYVEDSVLWNTGESANANVLTSTSGATAVTDYLGKTNTDVIISQFGISTVPAAKYCRSYRSKDNRNGYLGSAGEWDMVLKNINIVNTCLSKIGGIIFPESQSRLYWSSTQYNSKICWGMWCNDFIIGNDYKYNSNLVRPFYER